MYHWISLHHCQLCSQAVPIFWVVGLFIVLLELTHLCSELSEKPLINDLAEQLQQHILLGALHAALVNIVNAGALVNGVGIDIQTV